jgi:hypothetical protein
MEKTIKTAEVTIRKEKDGIVIANNLGDEWRFLFTRTALDALVLALSQTMRAQYEKQDLFRHTFEIEMTIK